MKSEKINYGRPDPEIEEKRNSLIYYLMKQTRNSGISKMKT